MKESLRPALREPIPQVILAKQLDHRISAVLNLLAAPVSSETYDVDALAAHVNLSISRLRSVFRAEMGMPLSRYIKQVRLQRAHLLLQCTFLSVKQVMADVGLGDHSHFARDYKRQFGESPSGTRASSIKAKASFALTSHKGSFSQSRSDRYG